MTKTEYESIEAGLKALISQVNETKGLGYENAHKITKIINEQIKFEKKFALLDSIIIDGTTYYYNDYSIYVELSEGNIQCLCNHEGRRNIKAFLENYLAKSKIIGYYVCKDEEINASSIFVAINELHDYHSNRITCYAPIGQHGALDREYLKECREITKEEYIQHSRGIYTPEDYL